MKYDYRRVNAPYPQGDEAKKEIKRILADENTLFIKVQTTGLDKTARVLTVTLMTADGHWTKRCFNPGMELTEDTERYTGISNGEAASWDSWESGALDITAMLNGRAIIGWNVGFDADAIKREMLRINAPNPFADAASVCDAMELYSGAIGRETRFMKFVDAIGRKAPIDPEEYLEAEIELLKAVIR